MIFVIALVVIAAMAAALLFALNQEAKEDAASSPIDFSKFKIHLETTLGVRVSSVNPLPWYQIATIEQAFADKFLRARERGYVNKLEYNAHKVWVIPPARTHNDAGEYAPDFYLRADNYDGSVFDRDPTPGVGLITAAEYVLPDNSGFVIPEYTQDFDKCYEAVGNGLDHIILYYNDRTLYEATKTHTDESNYHPLIK